MRTLTAAETYAVFRRHGKNSSHFVWFLAGLEFVQASNGWVFAFKRRGDVILLALEPLHPLASQSDPATLERDFDVAWDEFCAQVQPRVSMFISVYGPFASLLEKKGFQILKAGEEPWVRLDDCIPRGNAGKGVRSARNQALKNGLSVEEWTAAEIEQDPAKRAVMGDILHEWKSTRLVRIEAFLNATDPFSHMEDRRYFILKSPERAEAFLVATPVPGINSFFLEDMAIRKGAPRGSGELLTLEAMVALRDSGAELASLGVVAVTTVDSGCGRNLPRAMQVLLLEVPRLLRKFYNFDGLEVYRKRFKPHAWEEIHLAVRNHQPEARSDTRSWLKALVAMALSFEPRIRLSREWLSRAALRPFHDYPITISVAAISFSLFALVNRFGNLPDWALSRFGFTGSAPWRQWLFRSVTSDFLYFNPAHFYVVGGLFFGLLAWSEKTRKRSLVLGFLMFMSMFDDLINYWVLVKPFNFFQPHIFQRLIGVKDVGGSLCLVAFLGLQLTTFRKMREYIMVGLMVALVLGYTFASDHFHVLVGNLNHFIFLALGFLAGKAKFEYDRMVSRKVAKGKPPVAKCVLTQGTTPPPKIAA